MWCEPDTTVHMSGVCISCLLSVLHAKHCRTYSAAKSQRTKLDQSVCRLVPSKLSGELDRDEVEADTAGAADTTGGS